ncbi:RrF2 family transcriptional regulator [Veillonella montpellierensis]|uniref:RrF2 family transcriptional regulator n=1 Tax=Veillonella montpellierensis TaxID=187328 RepID=UPI00042222AB|nr:RrF2 family transcriptional regulator [Veillonella montpellierensis]
MKISTKGRYALRVLADIAEHGTDKNVSIREMAERQEISDKYLEGIVARLSAAGFVKSGRGKYGGYRLTREPKDYNVYEILNAAEDSIALVACLEDDADICPRADSCLTMPLWTHLQLRFRECMEEISLQDVMDRKFSV